MRSLRGNRKSVKWMAKNEKVSLESRLSATNHLNVWVFFPDYLGLGQVMPFNTEIRKHTGERFRVLIQIHWVIFSLTLQNCLVWMQLFLLEVWATTTWDFECIKINVVRQKWSKSLAVLHRLGCQGGVDIPRSLQNEQLLSLEFLEFNAFMLSRQQRFSSKKSKPISLAAWGVWTSGRHEWGSEDKMQRGSPAC